MYCYHSKSGVECVDELIRPPCCNAIVCHRVAVEEGKASVDGLSDLNALV